MSSTHVQLVTRLVAMLLILISQSSKEMPSASLPMLLLLLHLNSSTHSNKLTGPKDARRLQSMAPSSVELETTQAQSLVLAMVRLPLESSHGLASF